MHHPEKIIVLAFLSHWLSGCATSALDMAPARFDRPWTPATSATGEILPGAPPAPRQAGGATYVLPPNAALAKLPPAPDLARHETYSLAQLIDVAETNNPATRTAWDDARNIALAAGIAESAYLPRLTASVVGGYQAVSGQNTTMGVSLQQHATAEGAISALSLEWLLFDFGERAATVDAAKQAVIISNIAFTAVHQNVIHEVSLAFYANAAARARIATTTQSLKNAEEIQAAAEDRYNHGVGTVVAVEQARQATAQRKLVLVQASGAAENTYVTLLSAMGISPLAHIDVEDIPDRPLPSTLADSVEQIVATALARRPDVLSAYAAQKASLANVAAAQAGFMPKFFLSATGAYGTGHLGVTAIPSIGQQAGTVNLTGSNLNATVLGGVTVPLYDGGVRAAALAQARAKADDADAALTRTQDQAAREIVLAENSLRTSLAAHDSATALASAAQTTFDAALAAYRNGVGSLTDASFAETQLLEAKNAYTDSYSAALSAAATLAFATGELGAAPQ